jgi:hypothetical protein
MGVDRSYIRQSSPWYSYQTMAYFENDFDKDTRRIGQQQILYLIDAVGLRIIQSSYPEFNVIL